MDIEELIKSGILKEFNNTSQIKRGYVVRRINSNKDQQGLFTGFDENGGLIIVNVIDMSSNEYIAEAGVIRPSDEDRLFHYTSSFSQDNKTTEAMELLRSWPLYKKHPDLQMTMENFFKSSYSPKHILQLKKNDMLDAVFVPLQQKLKIGRFAEVINWDSLRKEMFHTRLIELKPGDHMTYLALIPPSTSYSPKFYSIGTKPHEETLFSLRSEGFNFKPTHGGHIKAEKSDNGIIYHVDAGSNFIGKGVKTKLETAESITKALKREYSNLTFIPLEGRGAFGTEQSY